MRLITIIILSLSVIQTGYSQEKRISIRNGWITSHEGAIIGNGKRTDYWGGYRQCPSSVEWVNSYKTYSALTRNAGNDTGPCRTEDLAKLTDAMLEFGYPVFVHNYGLWYDRRRDCHDENMRLSPPQDPFHEQPWARSAVPGAWDGGNKYDLLRYNTWYFKRLKEFASLCDKKGTVLIYQFYNQHNILESPCHYVDFPWRPVNCIQSTGMPDKKPANDISAYNLFYDISDTVRRTLHRAYIRKCLDELSDFSNVIFDISREYTGPLSFTLFWLDNIIEWQREKGKNVMISVGATKDVQDAVLSDPSRSYEIDVINLAYWWYLEDGSLNAPPGGKGVPGRYADGNNWAKKTTPFQIYRQVREVRDRYPGKAIIHAFEGTREQTLAFIMGGGSVIVRYLDYPDSKPPLNPWDPPVDYIMPEDSRISLPVYRFINQYLKDELINMQVTDIVNNPEKNWCLGDRGKNYLIYTLGGENVIIDLTDETRKRFEARWINPRNGEHIGTGTLKLSKNKKIEINPPDMDDWLLWLSI